MLPAKTPSHKNRFVEQLIQSTTTDNCEPITNQTQFPDRTTEITLLWSVNGDDFKKVFSALNYGADFAYPSNAISIVSKFLELVCANVDICNEINNCIANNTETSAAIIDLLIANGYGSGGQTTIEPTKLPVSVTSENLLPINYICDDIHLCGMSRWIVTNMHDGVIQMLQQLEISTNTWELISLFVDNVEVVSWLGSALEFAVWVQDQLLVYYEAAWSTVIEDNLTCDVFCQIKPDCNINIDTLLTAYEAAILESFSLPSLLSEVSQLWDWLEGLDYETANAKSIVGSFHWAMIQALSFGGKVLKYTSGIRSFEQMIATGADETDTYCDTACACSAQSCVEYDFTLSDNGFTVWTTGNRPFGVYVASIGWQCTWNAVGASNDNRIYIENINFPNGNLLITRIEIVVTPTNGGNARDIGLFVMNGTTPVNIQTGTPQTIINSIPQTIGADFNASGNGLRTSIVTDTQSPQQDAITITKLRVFYTLGTPSGGIPC